MRYKGTVRVFGLACDDHCFLMQAPQNFEEGYRSSPALKLLLSTYSRTSGILFDYRSSSLFNAVSNFTLNYVVR